MNKTVSIVGYWMPYHSATVVQGYPPPKYFIPALETQGYDVDFVNLNDLKKEGNEIKRGIQLAKSDNIILSYWDYIYERDLDSIFADKSKKIIFQKNWNEESTTLVEKKQIINNSAYVTLSQDRFREEWLNELGEFGEKNKDKLKVWRFPCTTGAILDKQACRERIGITTDYTIIVWGYYHQGNKKRGHNHRKKLSFTS